MQSCGHEMCLVCWSRHQQTGCKEGKIRCPICRQSLQTDSPYIRVRRPQRRSLDDPSYFGGPSTSAGSSHSNPMMTRGMHRSVLMNDSNPPRIAATGDTEVPKSAHVTSSKIEAVPFLTAHPPLVTPTDTHMVFNPPSVSGCDSLSVQATYPPPPPTVFIPAGPSSSSSRAPVVIYEVTKKCDGDGNDLDSEDGSMKAAAADEILAMYRKMGRDVPVANPLKERKFLVVEGRSITEQFSVLFVDE